MYVQTGIGLFELVASCCCDLEDDESETLEEIAEDNGGFVDAVRLKLALEQTPNQQG